MGNLVSHNSAGMASDSVVGEGGPHCHRVHIGEESRVPVCIPALFEGIYEALAQLELQLPKGSKAGCGRWQDTVGS